MLIFFLFNCTFQKRLIKFVEFFCCYLTINKNIIMNLLNLIFKPIKHFIDRYLNNPIKVTLFFAIIFTLIFSIIFIRTLNVTEGNYVYPLDDTYIHLQIAKNYVTNFTWGMTAGEFCSSSSSPFYTLLLSAIIYLFGDSSYTPLIINLIFAIGIVFLIYFQFKDNKYKLFIFYFALICPVFLHIQIWSGMEHTMQLFALLLVIITLNNLKINSFSETLNSNLISYSLSIALFSLTRYESMFMFAGIVLYFILNKKYKLSIITLFMGFTPIILFGLFSINNGGEFFPNSLLLKSNIQIQNGILPYIINFLKRYVYTKNIPFLILFYSMIFIFIKFIFDNVFSQNTNIKDKKINVFLINFYTSLINSPFLFISTITSICHISFASFGWLFRYEAYLYLLIIFTILTEFDKIVENKIFIKRNQQYLILILLGIFFTQSYRIYNSISKVVYASRNIYEQQIQTTRFINKYYNKQNIIANDIGAITYFNDIKLLDLAGLGSNTILKERRQNSNFDNEIVKILEKDIYLKYNFAFIYERWYPNSNLKSKWYKAGDWNITDNTICGDDRVSIFVRNKQDLNKMKIDLEDFKKYINKNVITNVEE